MRWVFPLLLLVLSASAQQAPPALQAAWQDALAMSEAGETSQAITAFVALDRQLRDEALRPQRQLARYYILHNLAQAKRYPDMVARLDMVDRDLLPDAFRADLVRLKAEALLETGDAPAALAELAAVRSLTGRMDLLRGRALAVTGDVDAARDALARGLVSADDATRLEKEIATQVLTGILEKTGRLGEAEHLRHLLHQVAPERSVAP